MPEAESTEALLARCMKAHRMAEKLRIARWLVKEAQAYSRRNQHTVAKVLAELALVLHEDTKLDEQP